MREQNLSESAIKAHDSQRNYIPVTEISLALEARLIGRGLCLDAGVGTGANALPLAASGIPMIGIDISPAMLKTLQANRAENLPLYLSYADLTALPFADKSFGAAHAAHIFHLIPNWQDAVSELCRVIVDKGILLVNLGEASPLRKQILSKFHEFLAGEFAPEGEAAGLKTAEDFHACLAANHAKQLAPLELPNPKAPSPEEIISRLEKNVFMWSSQLEPAKLSEAARHVREWALQNFALLDESVAQQNFIKYYIYEMRG